MAAIDLEETRSAEPAVGEQRRRLALAAANLGDWLWDIGSDRLSLSDRACLILGLTPGSPLTFEGSLQVLHPEERERVRAAVAHAVETGTDYDVEYRALWPGGEVRWIGAKGRAFYGADGRPQRMLGIVQDLTERREVERALLAELSHRVKNTLTTVLAIASQTLQTASSMEAFRQAFSGRLQALAEVHTLLTEGNWQRAELAALVQRTLAPYAGPAEERLRIAGPPIALRPQAALTLGMVLHELATNAARHGALSSPGGSVEVSWTRSEGDGAAELRLLWQESGGPPVAPPAKRGFGTNLISFGVAHQLQGEARLDYPAEGLRCELRIPEAPELFSPA